MGINKYNNTRTGMTESLTTNDSNLHSRESRILQSTGGVEPSANEHVNSGIRPRRGNLYNRSLAGYERAINNGFGEEGPCFRIEDWKGKSVLDLGSGAYESFGVNARKDGVRVVSVNPALAEEDHRRLLLEDNRMSPDDRKHKFGRRVIRTVRTLVHDIRPGNMTVAAEAQALPFCDEAFDGVVSVYGVPHYLYPMARADSDAKKLALYTDDKRQESVEEIRQALSEIARVLKPGGKAYLVDDHRLPGQAEGITTYSAPDGSELVEAVDDLKSVDYRIFKSIVESRDQDRRGVCRTTVITKL